MAADLATRLRRILVLYYAIFAAKIAAFFLP